MRLTWNAYYALLYLYRCAFSVLGQLVVLRLTAIPDTTGFQATDLNQLMILAQQGAFDTSFAMQRQAGFLTQAIAGGFYLLGGGSALVINLGFQTIAFIGILLFLRSVPPGARSMLAILMLFPSFTVWTSIASKEALVVFLMGILAKHIVDMYRGRDRSFAYYLFVLTPVALALFLFKPHFLAAVIFVIGVAKLSTVAARPATFAFLSGLLSLVPLYLLRERIDAFVLNKYQGIYYEPGNIGRGPPFLDQPYDTFLKAPLGMFRAFFGPTISEASSSILHLVSFAESIALIFLLAVYVLPRLPRTPVYMAIVSLFTVFWIMFASYPLSIANAGTAVRYRADYILLIYVALIPLLSRETYAAWRESLGWRVRRGDRAPVEAGLPPVAAG